jgi:CxxC-x17-CxxC domain-containing protein
MKDFKGGTHKSSGFGGRDNFRSGGASRGGFGSSRGGFSGGRDSDRPTMYHAICSDCGADCEVPFKPNGTKPVLCSSCFAKQRGETPRSFSGRDREFSVSSKQRDRDFSAPKEMFKAICQKCHQECEVPFKPTAGKPIFCSECFHDSHSATKGFKAGGDMSGDQLNSLNAKLDKIIALLSSKSQPMKLEKLKRRLKRKLKKELL